MNKEDFVARYFPEVDCGREPSGNKVTVQLLFISKKQGSIIIASDTREYNKGATIVCRVIKVGHIAYKDRGTGDTWKEGAWAEVGDIVLMPRYGGMNRAEIQLPDDAGEIVFATYNDYDVIDKVTGQWEIYSKLL